MEPTLCLVTDPLPAGRLPADQSSLLGPQPCVVTQMAGGRYAFPMAGVTEVGRLGTVTRLPHLPAFVVGVTNWRGRLLAVVDLRGLLGASTPRESSTPRKSSTPQELGSGARVVLVGHHGVVTGVLAEQVEGVLEVELSTLQPPPASAAPSAFSLLCGQLLDAVGPVSVVDVAAVCALRTHLPGSG